MPKFSRSEILALSIFIVLGCLSVYTHFSSSENISQELPVVVVEDYFAGTIPSEIVRGDTSKKQVIFTFDAGEGNESTMAILDTLHIHGVKGSFFLTGRWVASNPDLAKRIVTEGHEIFNHTMSHPYLTQQDDSTIITQLLSTEETIQDITGKTTRPYFRPPYGDRDERVLRLAASIGYRSVYWTVDALDWKEEQGMTADLVQQRILSTLAPGAIYLMHVGDTITGAILDEVFTRIEAEGYRIVSLTQGI